ncbi:MAG TPA: hypothetical protein VFV25_02675 [Methylibium sp.]
MIPHRLAAPVLAAVLLCAVGLARAQEAAAAKEPPPGPPEPAVRRSVIEDEGSRIEELKVRGQVKSITVTPKVGTKIPYEIVPLDASRDVTPIGPGNTRGIAGQRVWHVLSF